MKIAVFVKQVPDSAARIGLDNGKANWGDAPLVINPWDEYAVEAALQLAEENSGEVTAISLGSESAKEALKHALAMGCHEALLISDPAFESIDAAATAQIFAAVIQKIGDVDLAVFGKQAIDSDTGLTAPMTGRVLSWPSITLVAAITHFDADAKKMKLERSMGEGRQLLEVDLPALVSIAKDYSEPRYPSFMGIRKASKAEIPAWSLSDLGIEAPAVLVQWPEMVSPPASDSKSEMIEGDSPQDIAEKLADKIIEEGVL